MGLNLDIQRNKNVKFLHGIERYASLFCFKNLNFFIDSKFIVNIRLTSRLLEIIVNRYTSIWAQFKWIYRWSNMHKEEQMHLNNLHNLTNEVCFNFNLNFCISHFSIPNFR